MNVLPLNPKSLKPFVNESIPDFVVKSFNKLIQNNWDGTEARIYQSEAIKEILHVMPSLPGVTGSKQAIEDFHRQEIFKNKYLDVESLYQKYGWKVTYNGLCSDPYYSFSA